MLHVLLQSFVPLVRQTIHNHRLRRVSYLHFRYHILRQCSPAFPFDPVKYRTNLRKDMAQISTCDPRYHLPFRYDKNVLNDHDHSHTLKDLYLSDIPRHIANFEWRHVPRDQQNLHMYPKAKSPIRTSRLRDSKCHYYHVHLPHDESICIDGIRSCLGYNPYNSNIQWNLL